MKQKYSLCVRKVVQVYWFSAILTVWLLQ